MRIKVKGDLTSRNLTNRECRFGIEDEMVFSDSFGENTTFIGALSKVNNTENEYRFSVDKIERGKIQTLIPLDDTNKADLRYLKLALEQDYGFLSDEYEIIER